MFLNKKGSSALNYILIIGGAILIAVIVLSLVVGLGGSSKEDSRKLTIEAQSVLDFSQPMEIKKVITKEGTCSDNAFGTFTVFYNPISGSGQNLVIVEDYTNTPISVIGEDTSLKPNTYFKDVTIDLSENNLKCTDTFRVYIESEKNGQRKITTPTVLYWPDSEDHVASFTNITATPSNSQYSGYYTSDLESISLSAIYSNPDDYGDTYWTVNDELYTGCSDYTTCDFSGLEYGVNSIEFWGSYNEDLEQIYGSDPVVLTETDIVVVPKEELTLTIPEDFIFKRSYLYDEILTVNLVLEGSLTDYNGTYEYSWFMLNENTNNSFVEISTDSNLNLAPINFVDTSEFYLKINVVELETGVNLNYTFEDPFVITNFDDYFDDFLDPIMFDLGIYTDPDKNNFSINSYLRAYSSFIDEDNSQHILWYLLDPSTNDCNILYQEDITSGSSIPSFILDLNFSSEKGVYFLKLYLANNNKSIAPKYDFKELLVVDGSLYCDIIMDSYVTTYNNPSHYFNVVVDSSKFEDPISSYKWYINDVEIDPSTPFFNYSLNSGHFIDDESEIKVEVLNSKGVILCEAYNTIYYGPEDLSYISCPGYISPD